MLTVCKSFPPRGVECWRAPATSGDFGGSSGTQVFFAALTLTIAGFVPVAPVTPGWRVLDCSGDWDLTQNLALAAEDEFNPHTFRYSRGIFAARRDLGNSQYVTEEDTFNYHTWLNFILSLGASSETWPVGSLHYNFVHGTLIPCGLWLSLWLEPKEDPYPGDGSAGGSEFAPAFGGLFGLKALTPFVVQSWDASMVTGPWTFALKLTK